MEIFRKVEHNKNWVYNLTNIWVEGRGGGGFPAISWPATKEHMGPWLPFLLVIAWGTGFSAV